MMHVSARVEDSPSYHAAAQLVMIQGLAIAFVLPVYLGALARLDGYSDAQLAAVATADSAGGFVGLALLTLLVDRVDRRRTLIAATALLTVANLVNIRFGGFEATLALRFVAGSAAIWTYGCAHAYFSNTAHPERWFAVRATIAVVIQSVAFQLAPGFLDRFGVAGLYAVTAGLAPLALWAALKLPARPIPYPRSVAAGGDAATPAPTPYRGWLLVALLAWAGAMGAWSFYYQPLFAFSERIGGDIGLSPQEVGTALAVTTLIGAVGSVVAAVQRDRLGRLAPLLVSGGIAVGIALLMLRVGEVRTYWIALSLFSIIWSYLPCYLMGLVAMADRPGRFVVGIHLVGLGAATASTGLVALLVEDSGIRSAAIVAVGGSLACVALSALGGFAYRMAQRRT